MKRLWILMVLLFLSGCTRVLTEEKIESATQACLQMGGAPQYVDNSKGDVYEVRCYGWSKRL